MDEQVLEHIQNFCPCICGIKKAKGEWFFKDDFDGKWEKINQAPYTVKIYVRAMEKFSVDDFEEESHYLSR